MNGLINRAIEWFVRDNYGESLWIGVVEALALREAAFEPLMPCEPEITERLIGALAAQIGRASDELLEDLGTYLVSHPRTEAVRRLLRFSGVDFTDFLYSLDDLSDRARLVISDLALPEIRLFLEREGLYRIEVARGVQNGLCFGPVLVGLIRAMADDYGALVMLDHRGVDARCELIEVRLLDAAFADGRAFHMGAGPVAR
ncbi:MAG: heme NO-binding domain-containing protein [Roseovarius sp.]|nr:heme NO-binding domain-containing protein [Roseovarius sp.]